MHYQPNVALALPYDQIALQADYEQACGHYIARHYGVDVVLMFPLALQTLWHSILAGCPEAMAKETLWGLYGLLPLNHEETI